MGTVPCTACGVNNDGTKFCESCGASATVAVATMVSTPKKLTPDERYLANLHAQADNLRNLPSGARVGSTEAELDEIRKWEGPAAAREAATAHFGGPIRPQSSSASPSTRYPSGAAPTNVMAILDLVFGIGGGLLGIIFGHIALGQIERTGEQGRGLAMAGLVFGYLGLAVGVIIFFGVIATVPRY